MKWFVFPLAFFKPYDSSACNVAFLCDNEFHEDINGCPAHCNSGVRSLGCSQGVTCDVFLCGSGKFYPCGW